MENRQKEMSSLVLKLFKINAFKFGDFKMKSGSHSPVYFDLRVIVSFPDVMVTLSKLLDEFIKAKSLTYDHVCGVPYTALPIATLISTEQMKPMLVRRKEAKNYGTRKMIEGIFKLGDKCLIIEDVVTTGSSVLETVRDLREVGVDATDVVVIIDREQGGVRNLAEQRVKMHSLFTVSYLLEVLKVAGQIDEQIANSVAKYIEESQLNSDGTFVSRPSTIVKTLARTGMPFEVRAGLAKCEIAKDLFSLMSVKKTNLCFAADTTNKEQLLGAAEICGPYICILKIHADIIEDFDEDLVNSLLTLAKKHNFFIMEDRKFADIGATVTTQYRSGTLKISQWADLVTAHSIPGPGVIQGLKAGYDKSRKRGAFLVAEMSSQGCLMDDKYKEATVRMATEGADVDFIAGLVCQNAECFDNPGLIQLTPGVKIDATTDGFGQQYNSPEYVVKVKGADIGVVGRGITNASSIPKSVVMYRDRLWNAYCERIGLQA